ncbi:MAG: PPOX class F420-dependent enzyme [Acidimicrobiaceae bacterium]|nr:PPOX class F420-dependent enzyme [Acidimicrobiaceae bacterium]|tara:strand:+ start:1337 stop:1753 length:417 start_codon:yes stop_codon:yes gene_type:complete
MAAFSASEVNSALTEFLTERHLAILTLVRPDGRPHSTPIGFMWDEEAEVVKIITWSGSLKTRLLEKGNLVGSIAQVDGGRWVTFEGSCSVSADPEVCKDAVERYARRYSPPKDRGADRRVITMTVSRILASNSLSPSS